MISKHTPQPFLPLSNHTTNCSSNPPIYALSPPHLALLIHPVYDASPHPQHLTWNPPPHGNLPQWIQYMLSLSNVMWLIHRAIINSTDTDEVPSVMVIRLHVYNWIHPTRLWTPWGQRQCLNSLQQPQDHARPDPSMFSVRSTIIFQISLLCSLYTWDSRINRNVQPLKSG